jgi:hypothetical protein
MYNNRITETTLTAYVVKPKVKNEEITFNAGSFSDLINMAYWDYERSIKSKMAGFAERLSSW